MSDLPPPGYYPDPQDASRRRWWDGTQWGPLAPPTISPPIFDATDSIERARRAAPAAAAAIMVGIVLYLLINVASLFAVDDSRAQIEAMRDNIAESAQAQEEGRTAQLVEPELEAPLASSVRSMASIGLIGVGFLFMRWHYRIAQSARALGLSQWPPAFAIVGWLIPLANLVLPYLVMRESVPEEHPTRATIRRWWSAWIAMQIAAALLAVVPLLVDLQFSVLAATSVVYAVIVFAAGFAARSMILEIGAVHREFMRLD